MTLYSFATTAEDIANDYRDRIRGKVVLTTGVSPGGLGADFVERLAVYEPKLLILAGHDISKSERTAEAIKTVAPHVKIRVLELDLSSQKQIRKAAQEVNAYGEPIDVLVNNAGVHSGQYSTTVDGIEDHFGTNHIGHFLFTNLIMDQVLAAGPSARVVNVASSGHRFSPVRFDDWGFDGGKTYDPWRAYGQSKTANMLFAVSLAEKLGSKGLVAVSLYPGNAPTNLGRRKGKVMNFGTHVAIDQQLGNKQGWNSTPVKTFSQCTATHFYAAFHPNVNEHNGAYFVDSNAVPPEGVRAWARDSVEAARLWKLSEEIVGQKFTY